MLSDRITLYRVAKRLTQDELAERLYTSTGYISEIETGRRTPSLPLLMKLFELLDCSPNDLFEFNSPTAFDAVSDSTVSETVKLLLDMPPEAKFKVFSYAQDQAFISKSKSAN